MDALILTVDHLSISHYTAVAGAALWTYDYLLTIHEEAIRIWPAKLSLVKVLYLINRYVPIPYIPFQLYNHIGFVPEGVGTTLCVSSRRHIIVTLICRELEVISATWLMMIRVLALYTRTRWIKTFLYIAFVLTHIVTFIFGTDSITQGWDSWAYSPAIRMCVHEVPRFMKVVYFIQIPFEFLLIIMLFVHYWRVSRGASLPNAAPLLSALYRGGFLAFLTSVAVLLWAGLVVVLLDQTYWQVTTTLDLAITSTCISRVFLQLSKVATPNNTEQFGHSVTGWEVDTGIMVRRRPTNGSLTFSTSIQLEVSVPIAQTGMAKETEEWMELEATSTRRQSNEV